MNSGHAAHGGGTGDSAIGLGIAGLGAAGHAFVPAILAHRGFRLVAVAEPAASSRTAFAAEHQVSGYDTIASMLEHPGLDAVYLATPTELHLEHVLQACAAGKHVLVEKPMATDLPAARAMVTAAAAAGIVLLVGHSHSYDLPIQRMREIIAGGTLGDVRMIHTWCFTDWMHRPRRPDEFDPARGGGVTFRQGSHQFDIIRLLCGGAVRSVRAKAFDWNPARRSIGAHVVYLELEDGAAATAVYNGYGNFSTMELGFDISEWGFMAPPGGRPPTRRPAGQTLEDELAAKRERGKHAIPGHAPYQPFFGITLVSCEGGDLRQSPQGLYVYTEDGRNEIVLPTDRSPRDLVMAEFHDAIRGTTPAVHDGRWGLANLEVCSAALASSANGQEVALHEQVRISH